VADVRVLRRGHAGGRVGRPVATAYGGAVEAGAGVRVVDEAGDQTTRLRVAAPVHDLHVVHLPPPGEGAPEVEAHGDRGRTGGPGQGDLLDPRATAVRRGLVPHRGPGVATVERVVEVRGPVAEGAVVAVEPHRRVGHAGHVQRRGTQIRVLAPAGAL